MQTPPPAPLPATPENAIEMQMQFQIALIQRLDQVIASLDSIAKNTEKIASKQP